VARRTRQVTRLAGVDPPHELREPELSSRTESNNPNLLIAATSVLRVRPQTCVTRCYRAWGPDSQC
jgi:hypothetical protein